MKKFFTLAALLLFAGSTVSAQDFITKALDPNTDMPTFDWSKAVKFIPIAISESVGAEMAPEDVVFDATIDDTRNWLYVWDNTYAGVDQDGSLNSFGQPEDHIAMDVTTFGWSGCGFCAVNEPQDWSVLDDTWVFHFAIKSIDNAGHQIVIGEDYGFTLGAEAVNGAKVLGDFPRDNEWYYVDLPFSVIRQLATTPMWGDDPTAYTGNYLKILSGGVQGTQLRLDNIFWYKDNTIVVEPDLPVGDVTGDQLVDVEDVNATINIILKKKTIEDYPGNADVNNEGIIDVEDVNSIINIILHKD